MTQQESKIIQEGALAMAHAMIQRAMIDAGITKKQLAVRMNRSPVFVTRMMEGDPNLTVKTFAAAMAACGRELYFSSLMRKKK